MLDKEIDWFIWREGRYEQLPADPDGITRSQILPGLWLDKAALLAGDLPRVHQILHQGLASPEHAEFVARLSPSK